jgi:hypothetical protein
MSPETKKILVKVGLKVAWRVTKVAVSYYLVSKYVAPVLRKIGGEGE